MNVTIPRELGRLIPASELRGLPDPETVTIKGEQKMLFRDADSQTVTELGLRMRRWSGPLGAVGERLAWEGWASLRTDLKAKLNENRLAGKYDLPQRGPR